MNRSQRRKRDQEPPQQFRSRLAALRLTLDENPAQTGDQAIKLLEEYLESLALTHGYRGEGSLGRYATYLRGRDGLSDEQLTQAELYTQVRNCLAHTYGLQVSPQLAAELVAFLEQIMKGEASTVAELMTRNVRSVNASDPLPRARDLMLSGGYGRLPVIGSDGAVAGLLTERDLVLAQAHAAQTGTPLDTLLVADVFMLDSRERIVFLSPDAPHEDAANALRQPDVVACLVTANGMPTNRPLGIITHADLLFRM